jgi:hypothetical protein
MPSTQTIVRTFVMVGVGILVAKAWHVYGPTGQQVKTAAAQAMDVVQSAIRSGQDAADTKHDPRSTAPGLGNGNPSPTLVADATTVAPDGSPLAQTEAPKLLPGSGALGSVPQVAATPSPDKPAKSLADDDRMPALMTRLEQLGAADTNLSSWGSSGKLYRFSCRAPLARAPAMTQHFESVAAERVAAVEQVLAKVEAWRMAQRDGGTLRY